MSNTQGPKTCILLLVMLVLAMVAACQSGSARSDSDERPFASLPGHAQSPDTLTQSSDDYETLLSLEERIAVSDVVARVRLQSTNAVATREYRTSLQEDLVPMVALEFTLNVLEYLKGTGDAQITTVVSVYKEYDTAAEAEAEAALAASLALHDTHWDSRDGIVFLTREDLPPGNDSKFRLGLTGPTNGPLDDNYSIGSCCVRRWLPAASVSSGGASSTSGSESARQQRSLSQQSSQIFLLEVPSTSGGVSAQSGPPAPRAARATSPSNQSIVTLAALKARIAAIEQEITDGGGSQLYRDCIASKYRWERWVAYIKETRFPDGGYHQGRYEGQTGSGLPAGTVAYSSHQQVWEGAPDPGEFWVTKNDAELFEGKQPGEAVTARPLPAGEYRFYFGWIPSDHIPCKALPEEELQREDVYVTVTAPVGTVHEAFFDPATIGSGDGYISSGDLSTGDLSPAAFSTGDTTSTGDATTTGDTIAISSLYRTGDAVTMSLSPYNALAGHTLDFITGDGTTMLSLAGGTGDATAGTLTWAVSEQPWSSGDQLMLRITEPWFGVRVALSPRQGERQTYTDITISWADPQTCGSQYFVGLYQGDTPVRIWGYHPAAPTGITRNTGLTWGSDPINTWTARVHCGDDDWRLVGDVPLTSGLP